MNICGYSAIANELTERTGRSISRQQVYTWWVRRDRNGFPEGTKCTRATSTGKSLASRQFDIDDVIDWYRTYVPAKGGRPSKVDLSDSVYMDSAPGML